MSTASGIDWHRVVAYALTGEDLRLAPASEVRADVLERELAAAGWDRARLAAVAVTAHEAGIPYPVPVPAAMRPGVGAAQLAAVVRDVRLHLGLLDATTGTVSARTRLNADERRLLADVPPHYL